VRRKAIDDHELRNLEIDLTHAPIRLQRAARSTLRKAGEILDEGMRADASGHRYLPKLAAAVSHEMRGEWEVEVGLSPQGKRNQGSLAHIIVYGSINNLPVYDHTAVLRRHKEDIDRMFGDDVEKSTLGGEK
jgi:hypothetical protein